MLPHAFQKVRSAALSLALACLSTLATADERRTISVRTDQSSVTVVAISEYGRPVAAHGLGTQAVTFDKVGDEDGIECETHDLSIETSDGGHYRPLVNLCEASWALVVPTATLQVRADGPEADPALSWTLAKQTRGESESGDDTFLSFGVPETDNVLLSAACRSGTGRARVRLPAPRSASRRTAGIVQTAFLAGTRMLRYDGRATPEVNSEAGALIEFEVLTVDPLWDAISTRGPPVILGLMGKAVQSLPADASPGAVSAFVARCGAN